MFKGSSNINIKWEWISVSIIYLHFFVKNLDPSALIILWYQMYNLCYHRTINIKHVASV